MVDRAVVAVATKQEQVVQVFLGKVIMEVQATLNSQEKVAVEAEEKARLAKMLLQIEVVVVVSEELQPL
tara:strand:- start:185 stop:391 length:207 start_codon:yes stop_codon:yes gene_type:complete